MPEQRWCCDTLDPIEGGSSLHHHYDNPLDGCDFLLLWHDPLDPADPFSFSFRIRHAFAPSSQNNWQLALGATFHDGEDPYILGGLVLGVNYTGSDDLVKIWRVNHGEAEVLCNTTLNYQEQVGTDQAPLFRVEGDGDGSLDLYFTPDLAEQAPVLLGSCQIGDISWGRQLILRYRYSSSRDRALWVDQLVLEGHFQRDTIAPELWGVEFVNECNLKLDFSERVLLSDASSFILYSEDLSQAWLPNSLLESEAGLVLVFPDMIPNRVPHKLWIEGVVDLDGNLMGDTMVPVLRNEAQWGDLVFNEVMADPDPALRYEEDYLELFKRTDHPANLQGWQLKINDRSYLLDTSRLANAGGDYLLLRGITLPNEGAILSLYTPEGTLVHAVSYEIPWDGPRWKKEGGWSLESPDADLPCRISMNWEYSSDPGGGTPGMINSNQAPLLDRAPPVFLYAGAGEDGVSDPGEILLHFSEPLSFSQDLKSAIRLNPGTVYPDSVKLLEPLREILQLHFPEDIQVGPNYQLSISGLCDCEGNVLDDHVFVAGAVSQPANSSVLINEIMFKPEEGMPEYIELIIPGDRILDLQDLAIHLVEEGGVADHPIALSSHSRLIGPGQYLVITGCVPNLREAYGLEISGQWVEVKGLPGLKDSSGSIYLTDRAGNVVDMLTYNAEMHMELLDDPTGISLERISAQRSASDPDNWHSAASICGYATPGEINSQSYGVIDSELLLDVVPQVFSPDNDGYEDLLEIILNTGGNDWVIGLLITDMQGNIIRVLANNDLAAPSLTYTWDGEGQNGAMQPMGFYVIHARGFRPSTGEQWIRRKAVALVYR